MPPLSETGFTEPHLAVRTFFSELGLRDLSVLTGYRMAFLL